MVNRDATSTRHAAYIAQLVRLVEDMIPEGKKADFDASKWVDRWLDEPQPALGGKTPRSFLATAEGRNIVRRLLAKLESGAYA
jgi:uncharacterized protein (DUF2384 family)